MDARIREHADVICNHSVDLAPGDNVVIDAHPVAADLVTALHEIVADHDAHPLAIQERTGKRFLRAYLRNHDGEFSAPEHVMALYEEMDVYIAVRGSDNVTQTSDVDPETQAAYAGATQELLDERLSKRWCLTQYPAPANAQLAQMSTEGYENFVWDAILRDWEDVRAFQSQMVELLDGASEIRVVSGEDTDVTMRVADNPTLNDYGEKNLPGGEVFTAPHPDSVEGEVYFDKPLYHQGREVTDVRLTFEGGEVVDHAAAKNEAVLTEVLETDEGASRLGELGIGMNRAIDQFSYNMLFDEKMGDTVHMAVGRAYEDTVGDGNERNDSAVHVDMIVDMSENSRIEVDSEVVQEDGTFVFEE
ncbi:aminopeptidase [Halobacteriales archaeon QH_10_67_22]|nr:MAG: aminopeptidase [Halobacteriales archaeon QH_10_67_22]